MRIRSCGTRLLTLFLLLVASAAAQVGTSTITGRVQDPSGAVMPGVTVTIVQAGTNFTSTATTNEDGIYRVLSLQPGTYRISFEAQGFMRAVRDGVELRTGDTLAVDMAMRVGNVAESVEVTGAAALLETETSATGSVVAGNVLYDMPLYQRYVNSTLNIVPGLTTGGFAWGGGLGNYNIAGQRATTTGFFEDGVNGNDQLGGTNAVKTLQNSIAEVKVITTIPPAEYGHTAGGVISVVKKSGTNELHGMGSWYGRTRVMQHRLFFDRLRDSQARPGRPNGFPSFFMMPDGNLSGPVMIPKLYDGRNKTFFFLGYQRLHEKKVAQVQSSTPTLAMKQGDFNFPGVANANVIFDPATTRFVNGQWSRDPFPGNRIPQARFDPVARRVLEFDPWVAPNQAGTFNALGPVGNLMADEFALVFFDDYNLRLDHQFNPSFKIYGSYTGNMQSGFGRPINIRQDRPAFDHQQGNWNPFAGHNFSFGKTWVVSPTIVNDARVGYYRRVNRTDVPSFGGDWGRQLGIPNMNAAVMPALGSGNRDTPDSLYGITGATPSRTVNETLSFRNDTTYIRGTHALKFGYEILRFRLNSAILARPNLLSFSGVTAGVLPSGALQPNTGNYFAGFLTGQVSDALFESELTSWLPRSSIHSFYLQDDWKVNRRLTLNLGVRWDLETGTQERFGRLTTFDFQAPSPINVAVREKLGRNVNGLLRFIEPDEAEWKADKNRFAPRIGLAWQLNNRTVLRAGYALFYLPVSVEVLGSVGYNYTISSAQPDPRVPQVLLNNPFPSGIPAIIGRSQGSLSLLGQSLTAVEGRIKSSYNQVWNLGIQRQLGRSILAELVYVGSRGVNLPLNNFNLNQLDPEQQKLGNSALGQLVTNPFFGVITDPLSALSRATVTRGSLLRPYPQYNALNYSRPLANMGGSDYQSLQLKLQKRFSAGLSFLAHYTWSKTMDTGGMGSGIAFTDPTSIQNIYNIRDEWSLSTGDVPHRFQVSGVYELPFGQRKRLLRNISRAADLVVGGWQISGSYT